MSLTATPKINWGQGISNKLRLVFVAEFLELLSPACLGILYQRTSVGLRYGKNVLLNETFLDGETISIALALLLRLLFVPRIKHKSGFPYSYYLGT